MEIIEIRQRYDHLCLKLHPEAVRITNSLIDHGYEFFNSPSFEFAVPASRNIYQSDIYENVLNFLIVCEVWKTELVEVTVSSFALKTALKKHAERARFKVRVRINPHHALKALIKLPVRLFRTLWKILRIHRAANKISASVAELRQCKESILINTYLLNGSFGPGGYTNRYFGSFFDMFTAEEAKRTFLVPNFLPTQNLNEMVKEKVLYENNISFRVFCKESVLNFNDYFKITLAWLKSFAFAFRRSSFDLFGLVTEELFLKAFSEITFESFVNFRFMQRLEELQLPVHSVVAWHENHLYDRALYKGHAFAGSSYPISAYQGVILDPLYDFYINPTKREVDLNLYPSRLFTAGVNSPVFRWQAYRGRRIEMPKVRNQVLVGLSLVPSLAENVLHVAGLIARLFPNYQFIVRCHPLLPKDLPNIANMSLDTEKQVGRSLQHSRGMIGTGSALVLEAALLGVPTLLVREAGKMVQNPLPLDQRSLFTNTVTAESDLVAAFSSLMTEDEKLQDLRQRAAVQLYEQYVRGIGREAFEVIIDN